MGACEYHSTAAGKTLADAYRAACEEARAYNGHQEGYSGDIQTSHGCREFEIPAGVSGDKLAKWADYAQQVLWSRRHAQECRDDAERWPEMAKRSLQQAKRCEADAKRNEKKIPEAHRDLAYRIAKVASEKCGPAVALKLKGKALAEYKRLSGLRRGHKAWAFFGTGSC